MEIALKRENSGGLLEEEKSRNPKNCPGQLKEQIEKPFSMEEIKNAKFSSRDAKALGPMALLWSFFKNAGRFLKGELMQMLDEFHSNGKYVWC